MLFLYLHLFIPPFTPIWTGGDSIMFLEDAHRMLHGDVPYRDFLEVAFPATDSVYLAMFRRFGLRMWIPNVILMVLGTGLTYLGYFIAQRLRLGRASLLPSVLFLSLVYRERLDATHHWFSVLALMGALAVLVDKRTPRRVTVAGFLCGVATGFTQTLGLITLLFFIAFLYWEGRKAHDGALAWVKREAALIGSYAFAVSVIVGWAVRSAGIRNFFFSTVTFALRYYPTWPVANDWRGYLVGLPAFLSWRRVPALFGFTLVHALLPAIYVVFFWQYYRRARRETHEPWDQLILVALVGLAAFLSVVTTPTWARLYYVSLPALILLVWLLQSSGRAGQRLSKALFACAGCLCIAYPFTTQRHSRTYLDMPVGRTAFLNRDVYDRYCFVASQVRPGEYFFGGLFPDYYFMFDLRNPAAIQYVSPFEYTRPEQVQDVIAGLERHRVRLLLWSIALDSHENAPGDHLDPLRAYIRHGYRVTDGSPNFEMWIRKDEPF
jgi:hypothetical protein